MTSTLQFLKNNKYISRFHIKHLCKSLKEVKFSIKNTGVEILRLCLFNALTKQIIQVLHHTIIMSQIWQSCLHLYNLCTVFKAATKCLIVSLLSKNPPCAQILKKTNPLKGPKKEKLQRLKATFSYPWNFFPYFYFYTCFYALLFKLNTKNTKRNHGPVW
jgi:hypothetical protein